MSEPSEMWAKAEPIHPVRDANAGVLLRGDRVRAKRYELCGEGYTDVEPVGRVVALYHDSVIVEFDRVNPATGNKVRVEFPRRQLVRVSVLPGGAV